MVEQLLSGLTSVAGPFRLAMTDRAFDDATLRSLEALFEACTWVRHHDDFYACFIAKVDGRLPSALLHGLRRRVGQMLQLDLAGPVRVTAQRMDPGDRVDRHDDRPQPGYEAARLVVQLDRATGGNFRTFNGQDLWLDRPAQPNTAVAFELSDHSHHDVTQCSTARRSIVFNFWHAANQPDAKEALDVQLSQVVFADLPASMDSVMAQTEASVSDELSHRAGAVACLLQSFGLSEARVLQAYERVSHQGDLDPTEAFADWLIRLHVHGFDRAAWDRLDRAISPLVPKEVSARWFATGPRCAVCDAVKMTTHHGNCT